MKIYVAGKITGLNWVDVVGRFNEAKQYLLAMGHEPVIPTEINSNPDETWENAMKQCIKELVCCDAIALLDNWTYSEGAKYEKQMAETLRIPIYFLQKKATGLVLIEQNKTILDLVLLVFEVGLDQLKSKSRQGNLIDARRAYAKLMKDIDNAGPSEIGNALDKDHATAIWYYNTANRLLDVRDPKFTPKYETLIAQL